MSRPTILPAALAGATLLAAWVGGLRAVLPDPPTHRPPEPPHPVAPDRAQPSTGRAPEPVPPSTDPAIFTRHVATALWSADGSGRDETAYRVMAGAASWLGDTAHPELADAVDRVLATPRDQQVATLTVVPPDGLTATTTVEVIGARYDTITVRLSCRPACAPVQITS